MSRILAKLVNYQLSLLRNHLPHNLAREEIRYANITFSQFGEDMAVERWVERFKPAAHLYVDAGCFHPVHCSNTLLLYKQGWRGINIDFDADKIALFEKLRPGDHNVIAALSSVEDEKLVLRYESSGTNRLGEMEEKNLKSAIGSEPESREVINATTLNKILAEVPWPVPQIGYLNIDCEGHDLEVLQGLDLDKYRPVILTIEALSQKAKHLTVEYLIQHGYQHMETIYRTMLFIRQRSA